MSRKRRYLFKDLVHGLFVTTEIKGEGRTATYHTSVQDKDVKLKMDVTDNLVDAIETHENIKELSILADSVIDSETGEIRELKRNENLLSN